MAGTTYYISVDLNADTPGNPGTYVLNWSEQGAPNSGTVSYLASLSATVKTLRRWTTVVMRYSQAKSATVTRVGGADSFIDVDYGAPDGLYQLLFYQRFVQEVIYGSTDTNNKPVGSITNVTSAIFDSTNIYESYDVNLGGFYYQTNLQGRC